MFYFNWVSTFCTPDLINHLNEYGRLPPTNLKVIADNYRNQDRKSLPFADSEEKKEMAKVFYGK